MLKNTICLRLEARLRNTRANTVSAISRELFSELALPAAEPRFQLPCHVADSDFSGDVTCKLVVNCSRPAMTDEQIPAWSSS